MNIGGPEDIKRKGLLVRFRDLIEIAKDVFDDISYIDASLERGNKICEAEKSQQEQLGGLEAIFDVLNSLLHDIRSLTLAIKEKLGN